MGAINVYMLRVRSPKVSPIKRRKEVSEGGGCDVNRPDVRAASQRRRLALRGWDWIAIKAKGRGKFDGSKTQRYEDGFPCIFMVFRCLELLPASLLFIDFH